MEMENTEDSLAADALLNESISTASLAGSSPAETRLARLDRVADYEAEGLAKPDPLQACLAAVNADVMRKFFELGNALQQSPAGDATSGSVRRREEALNNYLRVARQIERLAQLEARLAEARQAVASANISLRMTSPYENPTRSSRRSTPGYR